MLAMQPEHSWSLHAASTALQWSPSLDTPTLPHIGHDQAEPLSPLGRCHRLTIGGVGGVIIQAAESVIVPNLIIDIQTENFLRIQTPRDTGTTRCLTPVAERLHLLHHFIEPAHETPDAPVHALEHLFRLCLFFVL